MLKLLLVGTWAVRSDGYIVERLRPDGSVIRSEKIRDRRPGRPLADKRGKRARLLGAFCPFASELEGLARKLADRDDLQPVLIDAALSEWEPAWLQSRITTMPCVMLVEPATEDRETRLLGVWDVRDADDLRPSRFSPSMIAAAAQGAGMVRAAQAAKLEQERDESARFGELIDIGGKRSLTIAEVSELAVLTAKQVRR